MLDITKRIKVQAWTDYSINTLLAHLDLVYMYFLYY